jgi:rhamnosyltransferase subunit A
MNTVGGGVETIVQCLDFDIAVRSIRRPRGSRGGILFVNGAIATTNALRWVEKGLAEFDIFSFDFPHLGRSARLNADRPRPSPEADSEIVLALIERLAPDYLFSVSWGGTAALMALARRPPSIRRAALGSYSLGMTETMRGLSTRLLELNAAGDDAAAAELVVGELGEHLSGRLRRIYLDYFLGLAQDQVSQVADHVRHVLSLDAAAYLERLRAVEIPLLCVNGALDRFTPPAAIRPIAAYAAGAEFAEIPGAGHFLTNESMATARLVAQAVVQFLHRDPIASSAAAA